MTANDLVNKLNDYPEVREKIEQLIEIMENEDGSTTLADTAEFRVIEQIRGMGRAAMQGWADRQNEKVSSEVKTEKPMFRKHVKKNSNGTLVTEK